MALGFHKSPRSRVTRGPKPDCCRARVLEGVAVVVVTIEVLSGVAATALRFRPPVALLLGGSAWVTRWQSKRVTLSLEYCKHAHSEQLTA